MKRVFGITEAVFDIFYLLFALVLAFILLFIKTGNTAQSLAGIMALCLVFGDSFHLIPRLAVIKTGREDQFQKALGTGKQITSITMTVFYVFLWQIGIILFSPKNINIWSNIVYILAAMRIFICLLPQNKWQQRHSPLKWSYARNIPFFLQGALVAALFFIERGAYPGLGLVWLAIILSFLFYLPVVFWANKNPKIGILMLPKTCAYLWMLTMFLAL